MNNFRNHVFVTTPQNWFVRWGLLSLINILSDHLLSNVRLLTHLLTISTIEFGSWTNGGWYDNGNLMRIALLPYVFAYFHQRIHMRELTHARLFCWEWAKTYGRRAVLKPDSRWPNRFWKALISS